MEDFMLDERLSSVLEYIRGPVLLDIGSDHAYLPITALKEKIIESAICGEVVEGPYRASKKNVAAYGYAQVIDVRLGDGLSVVYSNDEIDTVTICGMGGPLIASILDAGLKEMKIRPRLVLQANTYTYPVRRVLKNYGYKIVDEKIIKDKHHFYEVIVADYEEAMRVTYSQKELIYGPFLLERRDTVFIEKLTRELEHQTRILNGIKNNLSQTQKAQEIEAQIHELKGVIEYEGQ